MLTSLLLTSITAPAAIGFSRALRRRQYTNTFRARIARYTPAPRANDASH